MLKSLGSRSLVATIIATMVVIAPLSTNLVSATAAPLFSTTDLYTSSNGLTIDGFINAAGNWSGGSLGGTKPDVASFTVLVDSQRIAVASVQYGPACDIG